MTYQYAVWGRDVLHVVSRRQAGVLMYQSKPDRWMVSLVASMDGFGGDIEDVYREICLSDAKGNSRDSDDVAPSLNAKHRIVQGLL